MENLENVVILRAEVEGFGERLQGILNERRKQANDSDGGTVYLIMSRLSDLKTGFDKGHASKLPSNGF